MGGLAMLVRGARAPHPLSILRMKWTREQTKVPIMVICRRVAHQHLFQCHPMGSKTAPLGSGTK